MESFIMSNIYTATKSVINSPKLIEELKALPLSGPIFSSFIIRGDAIESHYSEVLSQAQIDEIAAHLNSFVEISALDDATEATRLAQAAGFDIYKRLIADINIKGGLGTIDGGIAAYQGLFPIRNMLKDGFSEYALRYIATVLEPAAMLPTTQTDEYKLWIRDHAKNFNGTADFVLDLIEDASTPI